jgi:hypothetical protein
MLHHDFERINLIGAIRNWREREERLDLEGNGWAI